MVLPIATLQGSLTLWCLGGKEQRYFSFWKKRVSVLFSPTEYCRSFTEKPTQYCKWCDCLVVMRIQQTLKRYSLDSLKFL